ncbi:ankyrin repeat-containing domain protein [Aspergillus carlsbadensis]|nr:ankyrin repeat-containing domain protein [Aspergillus carlsbadensis]
MASRDGDGFDEPPPLYRPPSPAPTYRTVDIQPSQPQAQRHPQPQPQRTPPAPGRAPATRTSAATQPQSKDKAPLSPIAQLFRQTIEDSDVKRLQSHLKRNLDANMILDNEMLSRPLHLAVAVPDSSVVGEMFRLLLSHGADPALVNAKGYAPIHLAAGYNNAVAVEYLVKQGHVNPDLRSAPASGPGLTALQIAAEFGHLAVLNVLITLGARVQPKPQSRPQPQPQPGPSASAQTQTQSQTQSRSPPCKDHSHACTALTPRPKRTTPPLYRAACKSHLNIVTALLNAGADPWIPDEHCRNLLMHAARNRWVDLVRFLVTAGSNSASDGDSAVHHRVRIAAVNHAGGTALHSAAGGGDVEILNILLSFADLRALVNEAMGDAYARFTALHVAAHFNRADAARVLLAHGADVRLRCSNRMTALHVAVEGESDKSDPDRELLAALIDGGVDVHAVDDGGRTAVDLALVLGKADVAVDLVGMGATISEDLRSDKRLKRFWGLGVRGWPSRP